MRITIFPSDGVFIVLSDDIKNRDQMVKRIIDTNQFDGVYFYSVKNRSKLKNYFLSVFGKNICGFPKHLVIDELFSFNFDLHFHFIFAFLERYNKNIRTFRFEEGILSYFVPFDESNFLNKVYLTRGFLHKKNARKICSTFYCLRPELYKGDFKPIKIPQLDFENKKEISIFLSVFGLVKKPEMFVSKTMVVYLASIYNVDGDGKVDEAKLINDIETACEPVIIKVKSHPRDNSNVFKHIFEFAEAPIELFPMCLNSFNDCVLLSSFSGSLLNIVSLYGDSVKCAYTTMLCDCSNNSLAKHFSEIIKDLCNNNFFKNKLTLVKSVDGISAMLKQLLA